MKQRVINIIIFILLGYMWITLDHRIMNNVRDIESLDRFLDFVEIKEVK